MVLLNILQYVTVEPILFLYMLLIRMEMNALQELIYTKSCLKVLQPVNISDCNYQSRGNLTEVLKEAAFWSKYTSACLSFCTLITSLYVASWSDRIGRRVLMLVPVAGTFIAAAVNLFLSIYLHSSITYLFVSASISGLTFGIVGIIASTFGYIADLTTDDTRTSRIVILEAMNFIGGTCGIEIGGLFLKNINFNNTFNNFAQLFAFEMSVAAVTLIYITIRIPRQLVDRNNEENILPRTTDSCLSLFSLSHIVESLQTVFKKRPDGKRKSIFLLLLALVFIYFGFSAYYTLAYYFVKNEPFKWSFTKFSVYDSIQTAVEGVALLVGLPIALHLFRLPDTLIGIIGIISRSCGFIMLGLSKVDGMVYSCAALFVFSEYATPTIRSILSKIVDKNEKGKIFAVTTILQNLCHIFSSLVFNSLFESTINFFPGLSFELAACLHVFPLIIFCFLFTKEKCGSPAYTTFENDATSTEENSFSTNTTGVIN